jgi:hypothetical protein
MTAAQLKLLLFAIFIGFSFFSWLFKKLAQKRAEAEAQRRTRAMQLESLRTGRTQDTAPQFQSSPQAQPSPVAEQDMNDRQRKLAELRRRAAQRAGNLTQAPGLPSAQVLAPQSAGQGIVVLPGGMTVRVNQTQPPQLQQPQRTQRQQSRSTPLPTRQSQPQRSNQPQRPKQAAPISAEQREQLHREQVMARQPVPRPPISRNPVSDTPDASETQRLNVDSEAATVTPRAGRRSPVRNLANMSQRDLRTAIILAEVFGPPKCMP